MSAREDSDIKVVATNRRARHEYDIEQAFEAGIALVGSEGKTLRSGKASLQDAYGVINRNEVWVYGVHIPEYPQASMLNHEPTGRANVLMHRKEHAKRAATAPQQRSQPSHI